MNTITYRKTKQGQWVVYGPVHLLETAWSHPGRQVTVTKRDGTSKTEVIDHVGKPFDVAGVRMAYGYLAADQNPPRRPGRTSGGMCDECQQPRRGLVQCLDSSGISGMCCPRCASGPDYTRSFC